MAAPSVLLQPAALDDGLLDLRLSDEQVQILDSARAFLEGQADRAALRAVVDAGTGFDPALWRGLCELGWPALTLPEAAGGLGLGCTEQVLVHERLGAHLAPVPLLESAAGAGTALASPGVEAAHWLSTVASGDLIACLGDEAGHAHASADGWTLQGHWPALAGAPLAGLFLLPAQTDAGTVLLAVPSDTVGLQVTPRRSIDLTQTLGDLHVYQAQVSTAACVARGADARSALERARCVQALALAAEQVGVASACLDLSLQWTLQREQFGRPIAAFQALKHRCAQMLVAVESARSAVWGAACIADQALAGERATDASAPAALRRAAAQARVTATQAALFCAQEAIQLHGGAGYTWEVDAHLYFRRAQAASQRLGPVSAWLEDVAAELLDGVAP